MGNIFHGKNPKKKEECKQAAARKLPEVSTDSIEEVKQMKDRIGKLKKLLEEAKSLRDDYIEGVPSEMVSGNLTHKVQHNWFEGVRSAKDRHIRRGAIQDPAVIAECMAFQEHIDSTNLRARPTNEEDIRRGNQLLNSVIEFTEKELESSQAL